MASLSQTCPGKNTWPELVGRDGRVAAAIIERENPNVRAIVLPVGTPVTADFRCDRVWVWVDCNNVVVITPTIGKNVWPELVGKDGEEASTIIESENRLVQAIIVSDGSSVAHDYRFDRVFVWVDDNNVVVRPLTIG